MIKRFCDICGEEITPKITIKDPTSSDNHTVKLTSYKMKTGKSATLEIEFRTYLNGKKEQVDFAPRATGEVGDFCKYCVIDAFNQWDDRPTPEVTISNSYPHPTESK